jgi:flagellar protein FlaG
MEVNTFSQGGQPSIDLSQKEVARVETASNLQTSVISAKDKVEISSIKVSGGNKDAADYNGDQKILNAVDKLNKFLEDNKTHAVYSNHPVFKNVNVIKIIDDKTGEVVQEIPPQKILDMVAKMCEVVGLFLDKKA